MKEEEEEKRKKKEKMEEEEEEIMEEEGWGVVDIFNIENHNMDLHASTTHWSTNMTGLLMIDIC